MIVETRELGTVDVPDDSVLRMVAPILGFEAHHRFALIDDPRATPFRWLQSLSSREVAFVVVNASELHLSYEGLIDRQTSAQLQAAHPRDLRALITVIIPVDIRQMRVNLSAPILVNEQLSLAGQFVLNVAAAESSDPASVGTARLAPAMAGNV